MFQTKILAVGLLLTLFLSAVMLAMPANQHNSPIAGFESGHSGSSSCRGSHGRGRGRGSHTSEPTPSEDVGDTDSDTTAASS